MDYRQAQSLKRKIRAKIATIDSIIEREYYRQAQGLQINVMDIPKLFRDARTFIVQGMSPADAVRQAIGIYCVGGDKHAFMNLKVETL